MTSDTNFEMCDAVIASYVKSICNEKLGISDAQMTAKRLVLKRYLWNIVKNPSEDAVKSLVNLRLNLSVLRPSFDGETAPVISRVFSLDFFDAAFQADPFPIILAASRCNSGVRFDFYTSIKCSVIFFRMVGAAFRSAFVRAIMVCYVALKAGFFLHNMHRIILPHSKKALECVLPHSKKALECVVLYMPSTMIRLGTRVHLLRGVFLNHYCTLWITCIILKSIVGLVPEIPYVSSSIRRSSWLTITNILLLSRSSFELIVETVGEIIKVIWHSSLYTGQGLSFLANRIEKAYADSHKVSCSKIFMEKLMVIHRQHNPLNIK